MSVNQRDRPDEGALVLRLVRTLPARRTRVYQALSDAAELPAWWGPHGFTVREAAFEPRVGAAYRIVMQPPEGDAFVLLGAFREVDRPRRLAYTFRWEPPDPDDRETLVTLALEALGATTRVELTQGEFATEARLALHHAGWSDALERLERLLDG